MKTVPIQFESVPIGAPSVAKVLRAVSTALLLLLAVGSVLACIRSYGHFDVAALFFPDGRIQMAGIHRAGLLIVLTEVPFENRGLSMELISADGEDYNRARQAISDFASTDHSGWGFGYSAGAFPQKWRYVAVQAPAWLVAGPLVLLSVRRLPAYRYGFAHFKPSRVSPRGLYSHPTQPE